MPGSTLFAAAVKSGDANSVADILQRNPKLRAKLNDPMPEFAFDSPALLCAVERNDRATIEVLLRAGADINARSRWWAGGFGVLDLCARELAPFLIESGAVVDAHAAARLGMLERLRELVSADPGVVHARGGDGQTPLHFAATIEFAEYLLERGEDIDARDIDHESTPAMYMLRDRRDVARRLVERGCGTDILMAAALGDLELVRKYLDSDPESIRTSVSDRYFPKRNSRSGGTIYIWVIGSNKTAHHVARDFEHEHAFSLLMERSPAELRLTVACELGDEAAVQTLLASHPGLVETLSGDDRKRLAYTAQDNNSKAVRLMLSAGWPANVRGQHNGTALHWAAWHGNAGMVRELIRVGAPIEARGDDWNMPPLGWALHGSENSWHRDSGDYTGTVEALLQAGAAAPTGKVQASEAVRAVLKRFAAGR